MHAGFTPKAFAVSCRCGESITLLSRGRITSWKGHSKYIYYSKMQATLSLGTQHYHTTSLMLDSDSSLEYDEPWHTFCLASIRGCTWHSYGLNCTAIMELALITDYYTQFLTKELTPNQFLCFSPTGWDRILGLVVSIFNLSFHAQPLKSIWKAQ